MTGVAYILAQLLALAGWALDEVNYLLGATGAGIDVFGVLAIVGLGLLIRHAVWD